LKEQEDRTIKQRIEAFLQLGYPMALPVDHVFDLRDEINQEKFKNAWYNRFVSPSVNNYFSGNSFDYESKKEEYDRIRNKKILLSVSGRVRLGDYDLQKQCFDVRSLESGVPDVEFGIKVRTPDRPVAWTQAMLYEEGEEIDRICLPVLRDVAEKFFELINGEQIRLELLWEIRNGVDAPAIKTCIFDNYYINKECKKDKWEKIKIRRLRLKLKAFMGVDRDGFVFTEGKIK
jgi:hypothetical protein